MTGHQVFTTLHTTGVPNAVARMLKGFPQEEARAMAADLIEALRLVVSQRLMPAPDGTHQAVREWLFFDEKMRLALLRTPLENLTSTIAEMVRAHGHSFRQDAEEWLARGRLTRESFEWVVKGYG